MCAFAVSDSFLWDRRKENRRSFGGHKQITVSVFHCVMVCRSVCGSQANTLSVKTNWGECAVEATDIWRDCLYANDKSM